MPNTIKVIDNYAFNECSKLENITLPSKLTEIGVDAFYECTGLQNITIPSKVENIKEEAFLKSKTENAVQCKAVGAASTGNHA